ncbi:3825_t:CDS:2 [Funneliformis caledonium]|uniref:3825_t:CDS:1 n=1 Tax=Funneliformis caledonium TaxID=1117310 RepID=A0A9N8YPM7_9GLOM|nr:3825_t:CDS:2 [Funneliformis caledonium]
MIFNKTFILSVFILFQNLPYASGLSYNDLRKNLIPDLSTLDENQIIELIYFPCHEHCIKVNDVSNVNVLLNPTLRTNQISLENKQAGNWQVQKQLFAFMIGELVSKYLDVNLSSDCQSIKIKLMKQNKKEHDVITRNAYDDSSSPSDTSPKTYSFKVDKKVSIETCEAFTSMCDKMISTTCSSKSTIKNNSCSQLSSNRFTSKCFCDNDKQVSFSERISEMLQPSSIKVTSDHCNFNCHEYQRACNEKCKVVFAIMEFEKQIESLTPLNIDVNLN